jgi:hypothetical protein
LLSCCRHEEAIWGKLSRLIGHGIGVWRPGAAGLPPLSKAGDGDLSAAADAVLNTSFCSHRATPSQHP